jgi:hypothetical protein
MPSFISTGRPLRRCSGNRKQRRHGRVEYYHHTGDARCDLLQKLNPLAAQRVLNLGETTQIAARPRKAPRRIRCRQDRRPSRKRWGWLRRRHWLSSPLPMRAGVRVAAPLFHETKEPDRGQRQPDLYNDPAGRPEDSFMVRRGVRRCGARANRRSKLNEHHGRARGAGTPARNGDCSI